MRTRTEWSGMTCASNVLLPGQPCAALAFGNREDMSTSVVVVDRVIGG